MQTEHAFELPANLDPHWRVGIIASSYHKEEIDALVEGATTVLAEAGIVENSIVRVDAPGSFEIPLLGSALAEAGRVDALIGLGIIVEGETHHARLLAEETTRGIMDVQLKHTIPFAFEVLYVKNLADAQLRTQGNHNKGKEAAYAVLHSLSLLHPKHS